MQLSLVVPLFNEAENVSLLIEKTSQALVGIDYELILVDDGSFDGTSRLARLHATSRCKIIRLRRRYGQTAAMVAGMEQAIGYYCATMDGDLQNDPEDLPRMLNLLQQSGADMIVGRRAERQDGLFLRLIPSRIANALIRRTTGVKVRDFGCTLKVFKTEIGRSLNLFGDQHRFIPILAAMQGAEIIETDVRHHPRRFGRSKYGIGRTTKVLSDLILLLFWKKYRDKPIHLLGSIGLGSLATGSALTVYLFALRLTGESIGHRPLLLLGVLLILAGLQFLSLGVILDFLMRISFATLDQKAYTIREILDGPDKVNRPFLEQNHVKRRLGISAFSAARRTAGPSRMESL